MVYLVYKTDNWHTYDSRNIIGIATSKHEAIELCRTQSEKEGFSISGDDEFNLNNISQTQNYEGGGEFDFEAIEINVLL
jgi:hypothetical protein